MRRLALLIILAGCLALTAAPAWANRVVLSEEVLHPVLTPKPEPPPAGQLEGACGLAVSETSLYVSDYYHRVIDVFSLAGEYRSQIVLPGGPIDGGDRNSLDGVCGMAIAPGGELYGNEWHQDVLRLRRSEPPFHTGESTGVAVDEAGRVYVEDRTHVAVYEPSGAPVEVAGAPLVIGEGPLADAYGIAVSPDGSRVYVPDAGSGTVAVFEPAGDPAAPVAELSPPGGFSSLTDAAAALDTKSGDLIVAVNAEPGHEHPAAALEEFGPPPTYAYLGKLACGPVFGAPSGIAADVSGNLYVTDGDGEGSNVFKYGPYTSAATPKPACAAGSAGAGTSGAAAAGISALPAGPPAPAQADSPSAARARAPSAGSSASHNGKTLVQKGPIRVALQGDLAPSALPREGTAPIEVTVGGEISSTDPAHPPQLQKVDFAFNRAGRLDTKGLPRCRRSDIDPSSTAQALSACRGALVGEGRFSAAVRLPEQSPFPSQGKVVAFNGTEHGRPVVFAHIYGTEPVPNSIVLPLRIRHSGGRFATHLEASLAGLTGEWGYVKSIELRLGRTYSAGGQRHSFLSAGCPAPAGFPGAVFPLTKASFGFEGGKVLGATLTRSCTVR